MRPRTTRRTLGAASSSCTQPKSRSVDGLAMHDDSEQTHAEGLNPSIERFYQRLSSIDSVVQLEPVLAEILELIVDVTKSDLAYFEVFGKGSVPRFSRCRTTSAETGDAIRARLSSRIIRRAVAERRTIGGGISFRGDEEPVGEVARARQQVNGAVLCAPLGRHRPVGIVYLQTAHNFSPIDRERIECLARGLLRIVHRLPVPATAKRRALAEEVRALQDLRIRQAMERHDGNIAGVARDLGVGRAFVYRALRRMSVANRGSR